MEIEEKKAVNAKVHWGKQKLNCLIDQSEDLDTLRAKLYSLTSVPPEKQKILYKGKVIKETEQLKALQLSDGAQFMLMGTAEGKGMNLEEIKPVAFVEEMTAEERAKYLKENMGVVVPFGLFNLGNTCYVNSTMQNLLKIPELRKAIELRKSGGDLGESSVLVKSMASLFSQLENSGDTVKPMSFITSFMNVFPQFAQREEHGGFQQQDADECFQGILSTVDPALADEKGSLIDRLFAFKVRYTWKNTETDEEPENVTEEILRRLPCIIDDPAKPVNNIMEGIDVALSGEIEKNSELMERNCIYTKTGKIASLPDYLIVQKIRFVWKEKDQGTATDARKAKILRSVNFPRVLDVDKFCTPELRDQFKEIRGKIKEADDEKHKKNELEFEEFKKKYEKTEADTLKISKMYKESKKEQEINDHESQLWHDLSVGTPTGNYELIGVITHKGRSADSGHYLGWTHHKGDEWYRFDDDLVTKVNIEDILALRGGGDWHMAYLLIYRKIVSDL